MYTYYLTFGVKYDYYQHEVVDFVDPKGFVEISAESESQAREKAFDRFGKYWAFLYDAGTFDQTHFPNGCFEKI